MNHKIITCAGYGNSGSSAAIDFFKEFSNVLCIGGSLFEFTFLHEPDGIIDLYYAITEGHRLKTDLSIKRFLRLVYKLNFQNPSGPNYKDFFNNHFLDYTKEYLDDLGIIKWEGCWYRNNELILNDNNEFIAKKYIFQREVNNIEYKLYEPDGWMPTFLLRNTMYYGETSKENFVKITKRYLSKLLNEFDPKNEFEFLLFDQLMPASCDTLYTSFFDDIYVVVVDRDPRDLYFANKVFWSCGYLPTVDVSVFTEWYKKTRSMDYSDEKIIHIKFENLIYEYEKTTKKLMEFVGLDNEMHNGRGKYLKTEESKKNTRLWLKYDLCGIPISDELNMIESELSDFCYNYNDEIAEKNDKQQVYALEKIDVYVNKLILSRKKRMFFSALYNTNVLLRKKKILLLLFPTVFLFELVVSFLRQMKYTFIYKKECLLDY